MGNDPGEAALKYHEATKHSEISLRLSPHYLDWDNKPSLFKRYAGLPSTYLPHNFPAPSIDAIESITDQRSPRDDQNIDLATLAEVLFFTAGLTRKMKFGRETHYMRAASATGALYPIELYIVTNGVPWLAAGVYHFNPLDFSLVHLREGNFVSDLSLATDNTSESSEFAIIFTSVAARNSWKYEARSYRHWFWDAGVMAANLLAVCSAEGLAVRVALGFLDDDLDRLLGLENEAEATIAIADLGMSSARQVTERPKISNKVLSDSTRSANRQHYPIIWETNEASKLHDGTQIKQWTDGPKPIPQNHGVGRSFPLSPPNERSVPLDETILKRGSTRRFAQKPISLRTLSSILGASSGRVPLDFLNSSTSLIEFYLIANDVQNLAPGSYYFDRENRSLLQLKEGKMRDMAGYLCLQQPLFSEASVVFFLTSDLHRVLDALGSRGYRAAQFEAGVRAGKIYLSAYSQQIGASGSTFYDDAVTEFFSPHAKTQNTMVAVGVGVPAYKAKSGKILPQFSPVMVGTSLG